MWYDLTWIRRYLVQIFACFVSSLNFLTDIKSGNLLQCSSLALNSPLTITVSSKGQNVKSRALTLATTIFNSRTWKRKKYGIRGFQTDRRTKCKIKCLDISTLFSFQWPEKERNMELGGFKLTEGTKCKIKCLDSNHYFQFKDLKSKRMHSKCILQTYVHNM